MGDLRAVLSQIEGHSRTTMSAFCLNQDSVRVAIDILLFFLIWLYFISSIAFLYFRGVVHGAGYIQLCLPV